MFAVFASVIAGCQSANYSASSLPANLQAAAPPAQKEMNLEQLAGSGVNTSQIGPGDLVDITILSGSGEERALPTPARVAQDGTIMVPLVGGVPVGGLEPIEAEQRIAAAASDRNIYQQAYVTVTLKERAVNRVMVLGAVAKPGTVELPRGSSDLASAIAAAGGLSKEAGTQVDVLHRGADSFLANQSPTGPRLAARTDPNNPVTIPLDEPVSGTPSRTRIDLAQVESIPSESRSLDDRDVVMVLPKEKRVIHVMGLVEKPNQFEIAADQEVHVLDAIAMAGGVSSPVADKVFVIRKLPEMSEPAMIKVSIAAAKANGSENLTLAAGDMVSVEQTPSTMTLDAVSKFFRIGLGISGRVTPF